VGLLFLEYRLSIYGSNLKLLLDLQKECDISMLLLTHDIGGAWTVSDRIAVLPRQ